MQPADDGKMARVENQDDSPMHANRVRPLNVERCRNDGILLRTKMRSKLVLGRFSWPLVYFSFNLFRKKSKHKENRISNGVVELIVYVYTQF